ncbi:dimethylaniline monooxygenase [Cryptococcus neoformans]|nr:dimethylaniline monooxygenase [Cryptococcus neoformans var. grubii Th84]OXH18772.1 dimethylaniline monooxygenase [Cryptococcus neoformans var. grubii]OXH38257.1 dimethylaniline monooxygenase [Cryptococcus neoformans var. grubii]OXH58958.1 dimethylaniline monooxygenase [Cryptococcus neoformans var. grubii]OXH59782.1 dimethylaniline monooxygenase [Cryptococcus neoformans var. grubii]
MCSKEQFHHFNRSVRNVAIIGSGPSGTPAARHLRDAGLNVRVFERQDKPGGIWNWRPSASLPLSVPTPPPSVGAFTPVIRGNGVYEDSGRVERARFSPPNPCYWSLNNNVPTSTMAFKDFPYPPGTQANVSHAHISSYVQSYVKHYGIDQFTSYNTRVERAEKIGDIWKLTLRKVVDEGEDRVREDYWIEEFDAVVAASGHYNAPYIPPFEGSDAWSAAWPQQLIHSQGYRKPEPYTGKTVIIVGIGTSGNDIAKDISPYAKKIYMVGRNILRGPQQYRDLRKMQRHFALPNSEILPEIRCFHAPSPGQAINEGSIEFTNGRVITGVDEIIFATGYQYSYPFLPQYHQDSTMANPAFPTVTPIVTNGDGVLNVYRDVFYIPDPTLTFLGLSVNTSAFSFFEYQALSIARVFAGTARLPNESSRWKAYRNLVREKGEGKFSHLLGKDGERSYVRETVQWLNRDAEWSGASKVEGHTAEWLAESDKIPFLIAAKFGLDAAGLKALREKPSDIPEEDTAQPMETERSIGLLGNKFKSATEETNARASEAFARKVALTSV